MPKKIRNNRTSSIFGRCQMMIHTTNIISTSRIRPPNPLNHPAQKYPQVTPDTHPPTLPPIQTTFSSISTPHHHSLTPNKTYMQLKSNDLRSNQNLLNYPYTSIHLTNGLSKNVDNPIPYLPSNIILKPSSNLYIDPISNLHRLLPPIRTIPFTLLPYPSLPLPC